jgi:hypothetical protein
MGEGDLDSLTWYSSWNFIPSCAIASKEVITRSMKMANLDIENCISLMLG